MPSKVFDTTKPTFYLDNSTLCDAFRAHHVVQGRASDPAYRPLMPWIERIASEANLCLSLPHIAELGRWGDHDTADAMARWYDALPIVWVRGIAPFQEMEEEYWTKVAAGITPRNAPLPFAPSLLSSFDELSPQAAASLLAETTPVLALLRAARLDPSRYLEAMRDVAQSFRSDRDWVRRQGWDDQRKVTELHSNRQEGLRVAAGSAIQRMRDRQDNEFCRVDLTSAEVQERLVRLFDTRPGALPSVRAMRAFDTGFVPYVVPKRSGGMSETKFLGGAFYDVLHLAIGAAYCDVFTCDAKVSEFLGGLRSTLGLMPQLSVGNFATGKQGFVSALMATWGT